MIFISHTHSDKERIEPFVNHLAEVFGRENIFYDSWSIKPGDSLIGKMEEGLSKCRFFFFFVSEKSLSSEFVALEWKASLIRRARKEDIRFIPLKLEACQMPAILMDTLNIDCTRYDIETIKRQMVDIVNGDNLTQPVRQPYKNVIANIYTLSPNQRVVEILARSFLEPNSRYFIGFENDISTLEVWSDGFLNKVPQSLSNGTKGYSLNLCRTLSVGFPNRIYIKSLSDDPISISFIGNEIRENCYESIPFRDIDVTNEKRD